MVADGQGLNDRRVFQADTLGKGMDMILLNHNVLGQPATTPGVTDAHKSESAAHLVVARRAGQTLPANHVRIDHYGLPDFPPGAITFGNRLDAAAELMAKCQRCLASRERVWTFGSRYSHRP